VLQHNGLRGITGRASRGYGCGSRQAGTTSRYASANAVQTCWKDSVAELEVALSNTDRVAQALIGSIKAMLVFD